MINDFFKFCILVNILYLDETGNALTSLLSNVTLKVRLSPYKQAYRLICSISDLTAVGLK
jgi:hypothetical protein